MKKIPVKYAALAGVVILLAIFAYFYFGGDCGGKIAANEADCRSEYSADLCRLAFTQANNKALNDYPPFKTQSECQNVFPRCMPHGSVAGYVPVPRSVCVSRGAGGIRGEPIYQRHGESVSYR